jgi:hypothetical protein
VRLRGGERVTWFWCVRAGNCQRSLETRSVAEGGTLRVIVTAYDDKGPWGAGGRCSGQRGRRGRAAGRRHRFRRHRDAAGAGRSGHGDRDASRAGPLLPGAGHGAMIRRTVLAACCALAFVAAACGAGAGDAPEQVRLTVTDDFGKRTIVEKAGPEVGGSDTVMRLLQRNAKVTTRYGASFVQSINGLAGGREGGRPIDWFYYVNGVLADRGATAERVRAGERVWWDRRDWGETMDVDAVVGSFPEPFVSGIDGERVPTRLECADDAGRACDAVQGKLLDLGVTAAKSRIETQGGTESLRVIVGLWPEIRADRALVRLEQGPRASGVYARVARDGRSITALDARGRPADTLGPGTGLIAATRFEAEAPTWLVTGTDQAGLEAAAAAFDESALGEKFALAVVDGRGVALPAGEDAP